MLSPNRSDTLKTYLYALQWLGFAIANIMAVPVIVSSALGLDGAATASFAQRTLLFVGVFSFLQAYLGHRYPILEGPAATWFGVFAIMSMSASQIGKPLQELRSDLVIGIFLTGISYIALSVTGLTKKFTKLFTPLVNGTFLILMPLLLSPTIIRGIMGGESFKARGFLVAVAALAVMVMIILIGGKGNLQRFAILGGIMIGWMLSVPAGVNLPVQSGDIISLPEILPWGNPTVDYGIILNCVIVGILVLSNHVASVINMSQHLNEELSEKRYARSLAVTGAGNVFAAFFGITPFIPYASAVGFAMLTGDIRRYPFYLSSLLLVVFGLFPPVGGLIAAIPQQLGYAILLISYGQIFGLGIKEYTKLSLNSKEILICSVSVMSGVGVMLLPSETVAFLHPSLRLILGNGLITGILLCIILDRILAAFAVKEGPEKMPAGS